MNDLKKCPVCKGHGKVIDDSKKGRTMRKLRENSHVGLRQLARKMELSASYLHDLEKGERHWTSPLIAAYKLGVAKALAEK